MKMSVTKTTQSPVDLPDNAIPGPTPSFQEPSRCKQ